MSKRLNRQIKSIDHLQGHNKRQESAHYTDRDIRVVCTERSQPVCLSKKEIDLISKLFSCLSYGNMVITLIGMKLEDYLFHVLGIISEYRV